MPHIAGWKVSMPWSIGSNDEIVDDLESLWLQVVEIAGGEARIKA